LLPVTISADPDVPDAAADVQMSSAGAIHIELPGRAMISIESGADPRLLRCVLESLRR
jgi:transposase